MNSKEEWAQVDQLLGYPWQQPFSFIYVVRILSFIHFWELNKSKSSSFSFFDRHNESQGIGRKDLEFLSVIKPSSLFTMLHSPNSGADVLVASLPPGLTVSVLGFWNHDLPLYNTEACAAPCSAGPSLFSASSISHNAATATYWAFVFLYPLEAHRSAGLYFLLLPSPDSQELPPPWRNLASNFYPPKPSF